MARSEVLKKKSAEIQDVLEKWAKSEKILEPGEQIIFSVRIDPYPIVVDDGQPNQDLLNMSLEKFFSVTREGVRIEKWGGYLTRIQNICRNHLYAKRVRTVGDLVGFGRRNLLRTLGVGTTTFRAMNELLADVGLELAP